MSDIAIVTTYEGTEINYVESENRWHFELRGRSRSTESLAKAKEAIDAPEPKEKEKPFNRVAVYFFKYQGPITGVVTSIAESSWRSTEVWLTSDADKRRSKEQASCVYPITPANTEVLNNWKANEAEISKLQEKARKLTKQLTTVATLIDSGQEKVS